MDHKTFEFKLDLDEVTDEGVFIGYASVYDKEDLQGDIVKHGAFKRTIDRTHGHIPILWQHDALQPIGVGLEMREDRYGLFVKGQLCLETQQGQECHALLKQGAMKGLSIGYEVLQHAFEGSVRILKELKLWEYSPVTFAAQPLASVMNVKEDTTAMSTEHDRNAARKAHSFAQTFEEIQQTENLMEERFKIDMAFWQSVGTIAEDDSLSADDRMGLFKTSLDQFGSALTTWMERFLAAQQKAVGLIEDFKDYQLIGQYLAPLHGYAQAEHAAGRVVSTRNRTIISHTIEELQALLQPTQSEDDPDKSHSSPAVKDAEPAAPDADPSPAPSAETNGDLHHVQSVINILRDVSKERLPT